MKKQTWKPDCPLCHVFMRRSKQYQAGWICPMCKGKFLFDLPLNHWTAGMCAINKIKV